MAATGHPVLLLLSLTGEAEVPEASLEIFIQKCIEDWIEAAVGVAQGNAQVPASNYERTPGVNLHHCPHNNEYVDGGPADDEGCHYHKDHAGDSAHVAVFLLRTCEQANSPQTQDHQTITYSDDHDRDHKGKDENADLSHGVPVPVWIRKLQHAHDIT